MKITSIKQQAKNPERVSVFVDNKYSFSLSLEELLTEKLKRNDELDGVRLKKLKKLSEDGKLRIRALAWVLGRPHSLREFSDYMYHKFADPALTSQLAEEFTAKGYLDELGFARWLTDVRQRAGKSNRGIRAELFKKGLARDMVEQVLATDADNELERLRALTTKKSQLLRYRDNPQKLAQYLVRQGFDYQLVKQVLATTEPGG